MSDLNELTTMTLTIRAWHDLHHHLLRTNQIEQAALIRREVISRHADIAVPGPRNGTLVDFSTTADTIRALQDQVEEACLHSPFDAA
ncbi:MAG: hypothetical protein ACRDJW_13720 [Thermomicrobiales bacterium]